MAGFETVTEGPWPNGIWDVESQETAGPGHARDIENMLIADDGTLYSRGGTTYAGSTAVGSTGLTFALGAQLPIGQRVLFGNGSTVASLDSTTLPSAHTTVSSSVITVARTKPVKGSIAAGWLTVDSDGTNPGYQWGGGSKADYSTGTVTVTNGSATVTGVGTSWLANVNAGMILDSNAISTHLVKSVDSNTQVTLQSNYTGPTQAGAIYAFRAIRQAATNGFYAVAGNRLFSVGLNSGGRVDFSPAGSPASTPAATDYLEFPTQVLGLAALRDTLAVFTAGGVYQVSGIALNLTDAAGNPQWRTELVNAEMLLWDRNGIANWRESLIVPCVDGVYVMDGTSAPVKISQTITGLYTDYSGVSTRRTGKAEVFNDHYVLPITDTSNVVQTTLVCRLTAAQGGQPFAWTRLAADPAVGSASHIAAYTRLTTFPPKLIGASTFSAAASSKLQDATSFFTPSSAVSSDATGSAFTRRLTLRTIPTGRDVVSYVAKVRLDYLLAGSTATLTLAVMDEATGSYSTLTGAAPVSAVNAQYTWRVGKRRRYLTLRLAEATSAPDKLAVQRATVYVRRSGRQ